MSSIAPTKYVHIFLVHETFVKFPQTIMRMIATERRFDSSQHLFVTPYKDEYYSLKKILQDEHLEGIILEYYPTSPKYRAKIINHYRKRGDWLFLHGLIKPHQALFINPSCYNKIIWRTWGSDVGYPMDSTPVIKHIMQSVIIQLWKRIVIQFHLIGVANTVDTINIRECLGKKVRTVRMPYVNKNKSLDLLVHHNSEPRETTNVLIGHSGYSTNMHLEIMEKMEKYRNNNIHFFIPVSYGDADYINKIKSIINERWGNKATFISEMLPWEEYVIFLNQMDIGMFAGKRSYALGNIELLISLKKTLYIDSSGIIRKAFDYDGIPYRKIEEIDALSFEEFINPVTFTNFNNSCCSVSYNDQVKLWDNLFEELT